MKIDTATQTLERNGIGGENTFGIQANSRAFQILSSNLYTNKIQAVIRELSCNARDSHVEAGKGDLPFDVHLPNSMEPWFSVTDYGLGLSPDQINNLYTTYFASTKTGSNDYIGALGLGSKSPFAYTDTFDVISTYNGQTHSYVMFINEEGTPSVASMGSVNTNEPNGVKIKLPVKPDHYNSFRTNAEQVFGWFDLKPVVSGSSHYRATEYPVTLTGTNWKLIDSRGVVRGAVARMGNVAYPINPTQLNKYKDLASVNLVIEFPIGELDVSASREELSYDTATVAMLEVRLAQVAKDINITMSNKIANCSTLWEARCTLAELMKDFQTRHLYNLVTKSGIKLTWNNVEVDATADWSRTFDHKTRPRLLTLQGRNSRLREHGYHLNATKDAVFVRRDVSDASSRLRELIARESSTKVYYVIEGADPNGWEISDEDFNKLIAYLGNPTTISAKSLPKAPRKTMAFKGRVYLGENYTRTWGRTRKSDSWGDPEDIHTGMTAMYVITDGLEPSFDGHDINGLQHILSLAKSLGLCDKDLEVWGINKTNAKKLKSEKTWTEFMPWIKAKVEQHLVDTKIGEMLGQKTVIDWMASHISADSAELYQYFGKMSNSIGRFSRAYAKLTPVNSKVFESTYNLAHRIGIAIVPVPAAENVNDMLNAAFKDYPLLRYMARTQGPALADFAEYVNAVDIALKA